jgi:hypothetical protein
MTLKDWNQTKRKVVCLYELNKLALILLEPSGVFYHNQVCGHHCLQAFEEGTLSFLRDSDDLYKKIAEYTMHKDGLSIVDANYIDDLFGQFDQTQCLSIDRNRLSDSMEAWVYINIDQKKITDPEDDSVYYNASFLGFTSGKGLLTWDNCD